MKDAKAGGRANPVRAIVTAPPYAPHLAEVAAHPLVCGLRLNTVMPVKGEIRDVLERLSGFGQPLWVDLKGRQLRVVGAAIPPYTQIRLSHRIRLDPPAEIFFSDGNQAGRVAAVEGDTIILEDGPRRLIGPGESVNIVHSSLEVEGTLTETDRAYLEAMRGLGMTKVMLSYVERPSDVEEVRDLLPGAEVIAKVESRRGLEYARRPGRESGRLMAARGDLFVELEPHKMASALKAVISADPDAVAASRLFESLSERPVPSCADICDAAFLLELGYRTFLLGDALCFKREPLLAALNLLEALARDLK